MSDPIFIGLIHNAALLLLLGAIYNASVRYCQANRSILHQMAWGVLVGGMGIVLMLSPVRWMPGIVFDTRTILLSVTGLFFGPFTTLIAIAIAGLYRFLAGGDGAVMGVATIVSSGLIGLAWRYFRGGKLSENTARELLILGVAVHIVMIISMFLLPPGVVLKALRTLALPVIIIYPLATMLLGLFIVNLQKQHWAETALRASRKQLADIFEFLPDATFVIDSDRKVIAWNRAMEEMSGVAKNDIIGHGEQVYAIPFYGDRRKMLIDLPDVDERQTGDSNIDRRGNSLFEEAFCPALNGGKGAYIWAVAASLSDISGKRIGAIETIRDINGLKKIQSDLIRSNNELQQLTNLIYHELQEPLRQVMGSAQLLVKRYNGRLDGDAGEFCDFIIEGTRRMKAQIDDLLAYCSIGSDYSSLETAAGDSALETAMSSLQEQIRSSGGRITRDEHLPNVVIAEKLLTMIFYNLLENSLKFRRDEPPAIHVGARRAAATVVFSVTDNGLGIAPEHHGQIFLLFKRLHHRNTYPGSGVGLAICKRIVERQHGHIWLESVPGQGSTFSFILPAVEDVDHV